ncbi:MAG: single-stranded DNA-binding protein [Epulopiscium sp. Nuni2H_MBin001]|nr:MAG: single-stranded DNA-binding protein [Epulopiscium sp. Nuni2H_MBin001]
MNKVILMGRVTKDPEVRYSQSATPVAVAKYGIAVRRSFVKTGEPDADFFNVIAFGKHGEFAERYFKKGQMVSIAGKIQNNSWEDQQNVKRTFTEIIVEEQHFAESKASAESRGVGGYNNTAPSYNPTTPSYSPEPTPSNLQTTGGFMPTTALEDDDDLPF